MRRGAQGVRRTVARRKRLLAYIAILGPGMITANAGNDAGGIATFASVGADFGYSLLWLLIPITISLGIVQEMCARMGAVTGKGLADLIRERFGVRWTALIMLALLIANAGVTVSEFVGIAAASELFGVPRFLSVPLAAIMIWFLIVKGSYKRVEKVFLAMSLVFLGYIVSALLSRPDCNQLVTRRPWKGPGRQGGGGATEGGKRAGFQPFLSLPGLTRQSRDCRQTLDARIRSGHDRERAGR